MDRLVLELALRGLALGDVADGARDQQPVAGAKRTQADLDRDLDAVLPYRQQLAGGRGRPQPAVAGTGTAGRGRLLPEEAHDRYPDQLVPRIAEQLEQA